MMMNKTALTLAGLLVTTLTGTAMAAGTADMTVGGTVLVGSCTPTLSAATVDFGTIDVSTLTSTNTTFGNTLGHHEVVLTIACDSPIKVGFIGSDNRSDTVRPLRVDYGGGARGFEPDCYGLGNTADGIAIGCYQISTNDGEFLAKGQGDGSETDVIINQGTDWIYNVQGVNLTPGTSEIFALAAASGELSPGAFTSHVFKLSIWASVGLAPDLNLTDDTQLDGSATLSLVYL